MARLKPEDIIKSSARMKITALEKVEDAEGGTSLKVTDSKWVKVRGKEIRESLAEDREAGIEHSIEIVDEAPDKFQLNTLYILRDGKVLWTFVEKETA